MRNFKDRNEALKFGRYVDLMSDAGFKAVFGDERNAFLLESLLRVVLKGERDVKGLTHLRNELKGGTVNDRTTVLDLRCVDGNGVQFDVEVQRISHSNMFSRFLCYGCRLLDWRRIGKDWAVNPSYMVGLLEDRMKAEDGYDFGGGLVVPVAFHDTLTKRRVSSKLNLVFLQLGCFGKSLEECETDLDKWCYSLLHMRDMTERPASFESENLPALFDLAEIANFDKDKKLIYETMFKDEFERYWLLKDAEDEGLAKGREEGREEGLKEGILKAARMMLADGVPAEIIMKYTQLPLEQILALG